MLRPHWGRGASLQCPFHRYTRLSVIQFEFTPVLVPRIPVPGRSRGAKREAGLGVEFFLRPGSKACGLKIKATLLCVHCMVLTRDVVRSLRTCLVW